MAFVNWTLADTLAVASIIFDSSSILLAYSLTRLTGGAPRAWYLIIAAFGVRLVRTVTQLYFDVESPGDMISVAETSISVAVGVLLTAGLYLLLRSFRRQLMVASQDDRRLEG